MVEFQVKGILGASVFVCTINTACQDEAFGLVIVLVLQLSGNLRFWRKKINWESFLGILQFRCASKHLEKLCKFLFS